MSTTKHTSGPWKVADMVRASVLIGGVCVRLPINDDAKANARLIAAAPALLQELKEVVPHLKYMAGGMTHTGWKTKEAQECLERVLAVIAEAEGKA